MGLHALLESLLAIPDMRISVDSWTGKYTNREQNGVAFAFRIGRTGTSTRGSASSSRCRLKSTHEPSAESTEQTQTLPGPAPAPAAAADGEAAVSAGFCINSTTSPSVRRRVSGS